MDSSKVQPIMKARGQKWYGRGTMGLLAQISEDHEPDKEGTEGTHLAFFFLLATPVFRPIGWCHPPQVSLEPHLQKHPKHASLRPKAFLKSQVDNIN